MGETRTADRSAPTTQQQLTRFGWIALGGSAASMTVCYITKLSGIIAPALGLSAITMNPHVQAVFMWGFALIAVLAMARDRKQHQRNVPLAIGVASFVIIVGTLYTHYDVWIETLAYVILVIAAFLNQQAMLGSLNRTVQAQAAELAEVNASLEQRVERQVDEIERLARLKRFLAPEIADLITNWPAPIEWSTV